MREPTCSIARDPRLDDQTIWTAIAPDTVFTVHTWATAASYDPS